MAKLFGAGDLADLRHKDATAMNRDLCAVPDCKVKDRRITNKNRARAKSILPYLSTQELGSARWVHRQCLKRHRQRGHRREIARQAKQNEPSQQVCVTLHTRESDRADDGASTSAKHSLIHCCARDCCGRQAALPQAAHRSSTPSPSSPLQLIAPDTAAASVIASLSLHRPPPPHSHRRKRPRPPSPTASQGGRDSDSDTEEPIASALLVVAPLAAAASIRRHRSNQQRATPTNLAAASCAVVQASAIGAVQSARLHHRHGDTAKHAAAATDLSLRLASRTKLTLTKAALCAAALQQSSTRPPIVRRTIRHYDRDPMTQPILPAAAAAATDDSSPSGFTSPLQPPVPQLHAAAVFHALPLLYESGESVLFKLQCRHAESSSSDSLPPPPLLVLKHYNQSSTRVHECSIFDHLQRRLTADDYALFVRQRLTPSAELHQHTAADLYQRYTLTPVDPYRPDTAHKLERRRGQQPPRPTYPAVVAAIQQLQQQRPRAVAASATCRAEAPPPPYSDARRLSLFGSFFAYYDGVMSDVIVAQKTASATASATGAVYSTRERLHLERRGELRRAWFWQAQPGAPLQADAAEMARKALRFVLHCLRGLAAHHACGVLLGDIKPSNLFYHRTGSSSGECRPVWGDYGHAANLSGAEGVTNLQHARIQLDTSAPAAACSSRLASILPHGIGTWPYQSSETFLRRFDVTSDGYALALSLLELLVGIECDAHTLEASKPTTDGIAHTRSAYAQGPLHAHLQHYAQQLHSPAPRCWDRIHQCAVLPPAITDCLLLMTHPQQQQRPSLQTVIQAVQALLVFC